MPVPRFRGGVGGVVGSGESRAAAAVGKSTPGGGERSCRGWVKSGVVSEVGSWLIRVESGRGCGVVGRLGRCGRRCERGESNLEIDVPVTFANHRATPCSHPRSPPLRALRRAGSASR